MSLSRAPPGLTATASLLLRAGTGSTEVPNHLPELLPHCFLDFALRRYTVSSSQGGMEQSQIPS